MFSKGIQILTKSSFCLKFCTRKFSLHSSSYVQKILIPSPSMYNTINTGCSYYSFIMSNFQYYLLLQIDSKFTCAIFINT